MVRGSGAGFKLAILSSEQRAASNPDDGPGWFWFNFKCHMYVHVACGMLLASGLSLSGQLHLERLGWRLLCFVNIAPLLDLRCWILAFIVRLGAGA